MNTEPKISILMNTMRDAFPFVQRPVLTIFQPTVMSLNDQVLQNFELVVVDGMYSEGRKKFLDMYSRFPVKYINALPNRFLENGVVAISSMKNKGLTVCEGEIVMFIDDCTEFPVDWTQKLTKWIDKGYWPMSLTHYYIDEKLVNKDSRCAKAELFGVMLPSSGEYDASKVNGQMYYGGSTAAMSALLDVNGLDEKFDGVKSLEDVDLGIRLEQAGYRSFYLIDKDLWHIENAHMGISESVLTYKGPASHCNFGLILFNIYYKIKANTRKFLRPHAEFIRSSICPKCWNYEKCLVETFKSKFFIEGPGYEKWLELQETFDLKKAREER